MKPAFRSDEVFTVMFSVPDISRGRTSNHHHVQEQRETSQMLLLLMESLDMESSYKTKITVLMMANTIKITCRRKEHVYCLHYKI